MKARVGSLAVQRKRKKERLLHSRLGRHVITLRMARPEPALPRPARGLAALVEHLSVQIDAVRLSSLRVAREARQAAEDARAGQPDPASMDPQVIPSPTAGAMPTQ